MTVLVLFPCVSRWCVLMSMQAFPYARAQGMGSSFVAGQSKVQVVIGLVTVLAASVVLAGLAGVVMLAVATGVAWLTGRWIAGLLGGLTGDSYGAINELSEVVVLVLAVAMAAASPALVFGPLWRVWSF
jgi:adenosylcobinamide-GDP ribazoletransferase